jgi:hypothetical protein
MPLAREDLVQGNRLGHVATPFALDDKKEFHVNPFGCR